MRKYTALFMEQTIGSAHLSQIPGEGGVASFNAVDDDAALAYLADHLIGQLKNCVRAELSSMAITSDAKSSGGTRTVDDSHQNPYFQEMHVKYDARAKKIEVDFESTQTALLADTAELRKSFPNRS